MLIVFSQVMALFNVKSSFEEQCGASHLNKAQDVHLADQKCTSGIFQFIPKMVLGFLKMNSSPIIIWVGRLPGPVPLLTGTGLDQGVQGYVQLRSEHLQEWRSRSCSGFFSPKS